MINLIPPEGQHLKKFEYWTRVLTTWGWLLSGVFVTAAFLLAPTYVLLQGQLKVLHTEAEEKSGSGQTFAEIRKKVETANATIAQLGETGSRPEISGIITSIREVANPGIALSRFEIRHNNPETHLQIQGTASTREALAAFKTDIERSPVFESAIVPIADLAKDVELPFVITITLSPTT